MGVQGSLNALKSWPEPQIPKRHHSVSVFMPPLHLRCHLHHQKLLTLLYFTFYLMSTYLARVVNVTSLDGSFVQCLRHLTKNILCV